LKDHPHSAERPDTWLSLTKNRWIAKIRRSPNHFWAWISNSKNRQPLGVYSGTAPVACIAFFGTITTFGMAYGFSTYNPAKEKTMSEILKRVQEINENNRKRVDVAAAEFSRKLVDEANGIPMSVTRHQDRYVALENGEAKIIKNAG